MESLLPSVLVEPFPIRTVRKLEIENSPKHFPEETRCRSRAQLIIIMIKRPEFPTISPPLSQQQPHSLKTVSSIQ